MTVSVAVAPLVIDCDCGCAAIVGGLQTVTVAVVLLALLQKLLTRTQ